MDFTNKYIRMCCCLEIQSLWNLMDGDFCYGFPPDMIAYSSSNPTERSIFVFHYGAAVINWLCGDRINEKIIDFKNCMIWLPKQDDLQNIAFGKDFGIRNIIFRFDEWCSTQASKAFPYTSMEQLWLALVMDLKFGKVWNGEIWTMK